VIGLEIYIILVEIGGGINLGFIIRLAENFSVKKIRLVNPKLDEKAWEDAHVYAARAREKINEKIEIFPTLVDAIKDLDIIFATSAITSDKDIRRLPIRIDDALKLINKFNYNKIGIVFGREATGLTNDEIDVCDLLINIETDPNYPTLNIAAAVAIILYNFFKFSINYLEERKDRAPKWLRLKLVEYFKNIVSHITDDRYFITRSSKALSSILIRGGVTQKEIKILLTAFRKILLKLEKG